MTCRAMETQAGRSHLKARRFESSVSNRSFRPAIRSATTWIFDPIHCFQSHLMANDPRIRHRELEFVHSNESRRNQHSKLTRRCFTAHRVPFQGSPTAWAARNPEHGPTCAVEEMDRHYCKIQISPRHGPKLTSGAMILHKAFRIERAPRNLLRRRSQDHLYLRDAPFLK